MADQVFVMTSSGSSRNWLFLEVDVISFEGFLDKYLDEKIYLDE